jgi:phosphohistidine phosphatase SixA
MKLFILRHGATSEAVEDKGRVLSEKGIREVKKVVALRRDDLKNVSEFQSSPMKRVRQTLDIAAELLSFDGEIVESEYLTTGSRLKEIVAFMNGLDLDGGDVLVSSHQSCTSILVLWLTGEDVLIPNGSLLAIEIEKPTQGGGRILWQQTQENSEIKRTVHFVDQF